MKQALLAALLTLVACSPKTETSHEPEPWQDIAVIQQGMELPRANYRVQSYSIDSATPIDGTAISLNGNWKFHWSQSPSQRPDGFYGLDFQDDNWATIPVPSVWERHGFGYPIYANVEYPFRETPFVTPKDTQNHVGSYRKTINIPTEWDGRRTFIEFGAASSTLTLWVNGRRVGYAQGSRTPLEFDITEFVQPGENLIAAQVMRWNDGSWLENQDAWSLSGIFRDVTLSSRPQTHIRDFFAATSLTDNYRDGVLDLSVDLRSFEQQSLVGYSVQATLTRNGERVFQDAIPLGEERSKPTLSKQFVVPEVAVWSDESPALYDLALTLMGSNDEPIETVSSRIGFRSIELENGRILINGYPVKFKGVNYHEFHMELGYVLDEATIIRDFELLKAGNFNAIRTSHYPQQPRFYELADEYGFFVVGEANLETHLFRFEEDLAPARKPEWAAQMLDRTVRMIERDKNHPSIVIWSPGNETGPGPNMTAIYEWAKERDPTRLFQYADDDRFEGGDFSALKVRPFGVSSDFQTAFYASPWSLERYAQEENDKSWVMMEYWHSMGNSLGNGEAYWETIYRHPILQGGFIWDWVDQGLRETDERGRVWYSQGGDYGPDDAPSSGNFLHNGVIFPDRSVKPAYWEVKKAYQPAKFIAVDLSGGLLAVENRYHFTDLANFALSWRVEEDGEVINSGVAPIAPTAPGKASQLPIGSLVPVRLVPGAQYFLTVELVAANDYQHSELLGRDHIFASEQFELPFFQEVQVTPLSGAVVVSDSNNRLDLRIEELTISFDKATGLLSELTVEDEPVLTEPVRPNLWRAMTDNDYGFQPSTWDFRWREARDNISLKTFEHAEMPDGSVRVVSTLEIKDDEGVLLANWDQEARVSPSGVIVLKSRFDRSDAIAMPPRVGLRFAVGDHFKNAEWLGRGPHENYLDRHWSAYVSRYHRQVDQLYTPYLRPQENGTRTDTRWLSLSDLKGLGLAVVHLDGPFDGFGFSALANPMEDFEASESIWDVASDQDRMKPTIHLNDLPLDRDGTFVSIDAIQAGVGGDNSWSKRTHNEFTPREDKYDFTIALQVVEGSVDRSVVARDLHKFIREVE